MNSKSSDIVIGIDFGTTYSGVSWAYPGRREIRLITNWPNPKTKNPNNDKVPSTFNYGSDGKVERWGYSNRSKDEAFQWFKILLEPSHKYNTQVKEVIESNRLLKELNKSPEGVVSDYLKILWDYTMDDIRREVRAEDWKRDYAIKVVITVPAMWSDAAKEKTRKAAIMAGMPDNITMITEPEAAALSVIRDMADDESLAVGDTFVVCDAGGGTVDLISYSIESVVPLQIKEAARGEGGLCGSVYLNIAFQNYIETLVGKDQFESISAVSRQNMMSSFDGTTKRMFNETSNDVYTIDLFGVEDDSANGIDDNTIVLKKNALKGLYDPVFLQIETLISGQIAEVKRQGKKVQSILLVGGFGESSYLYDRIEASHRSDKISILRVQGAWSSICRGATLAGLEGIGGSLGRAPRVMSRIARNSYGYPVLVPFIAAKHNIEHRSLDEAEGKYMGKEMIWLLTVGEEIEEGRVLANSVYRSVQVGFWDSGNRSFETRLYFCEDNVPPKIPTSSVHELCEVSYSIPCNDLWMERSYKNPNNGTKWRNCTFDLAILLGKASLTFAVSYKDNLVAHVEAEYKEDF